MARQIIDTTTPQPGGKFGEPIPTAFEKANANFAELYGKIVEEQALATDYYGAAAPDPTWPGMVWADAANEVRKVRNASNDAWITLGPLFTPFGSAAFLNAIGSAPLYGRDSVVGTVSQEGGVPTGALIQYGSNPNGEFWRFAGGLQICTQLRTNESQAAATASGSIFYSLGLVWVFPAPFSTAPTPNIGMGRPVDSPYRLWGTWADPSASQLTYGVISPQSISGLFVNYRMLAVGPW